MAGGEITSHLVSRVMRGPKDVINMVDGEIGTFTSTYKTIKLNTHTAINTVVGNRLHRIGGRK